MMLTGDHVIDICHGSSAFVLLIGLDLRRCCDPVVLLSIELLLTVTVARLPSFLSSVQSSAAVLYILLFLFCSRVIHVAAIGGPSMSGLSGLYTIAMKAVGASRRVFHLLDRVSSMPMLGSKCPLGEQDGEVELDDVRCAYPSRPSHMVLKISIVSQEPVLFNCSIEENIAYGFDGKVNPADIENATKMANARDYISKFTENTRLMLGSVG